jgi:hypothetical protein
MSIEIVRLGIVKKGGRKVTGTCSKCDSFMKWDELDGQTMSIVSEPEENIIQCPVCGFIVCGKIH